MHERVLSGGRRQKQSPVRQIPRLDALDTPNKPRNARHAGFCTGVSTDMQGSAPGGITDMQGSALGGYTDMQGSALGGYTDMQGSATKTDRSPHSSVLYTVT